jgi:hypothetical protein
MALTSSSRSRASSWMANRRSAHQLRAQVLADEALVLVVAHGVVQRRQPGRAGRARGTSAVFVGGAFADAPDVAVHGKAQRVGVDAAVGRVLHRRLVDDVGVRGSHSIITPSVSQPSSYIVLSRVWCQKVAQPSFITWVWRCG